VAIYYSAAGRSHSRLVSKLTNIYLLAALCSGKKMRYQTEHMIVKSGNQSDFQYMFSLQS
jgi:hypothetical protein